MPCSQQDLGTPLIGAKANVEEDDELVTFQTLLIARSHARHSIKQRLRGHRCNNIGSSTRLDLGPSSTEACHCSTPPLSPAEQSANGRFFQGSGHCWWITLRMRDYFLHPPAAGHPSAPHPLAQPKRRHLSSSRVKVRLLAVSNEVDDAYAHKTAQGVAKLLPKLLGFGFLFSSCIPHPSGPGPWILLADRPVPCNASAGRRPRPQTDMTNRRACKTGRNFDYPARTQSIDKGQKYSQLDDSKTASCLAIAETWDWSD
ncbi:hypothetical protein MRS44_006770 [Fusarium solani]|uniref:uncharacterized protein n=1 Tax=Fusarium solani TaxID=169388 RepID=UPI0032C47974|nr:hypothetical protein MRS44_006770 [Fusarium solani]